LEKAEDTSAPLQQLVLKSRHIRKHTRRADCKQVTGLIWMAMRCTRKAPHSHAGSDTPCRSPGRPTFIDRRTLPRSSKPSSLTQTFLAFLDDVGPLLRRGSGGELRDVDEAVLGAEEVHEGAEVDMSLTTLPS
jgi:hypothetical protein